MAADLFSCRLKGRRRAGWLGAVFLLLIVMAGPAFARAGATPGRVEISLAEGWRFHLGAPAGDATRPGFDDSRWQRVSVPHTWNRLGNYGEKRMPEANTTRGEGWYRLRFRAPDLGGGKRLYLQFDAASILADVWLNGKRLGGHAGAFSRFRLDATDGVRPGENLLAVRVDNSEPAPGSRTANVVPISGDFFMYGGLYRPVSMLVVGAAHIELLDHGGPGIYLRTTALDDARATVAVRSLLRNDAARPAILELRTRIEDADGRVVASRATPVALDPRAATERMETLTIDRPRRWNGRADPYLYRTVVEVRSRGALIDRVVQPLGLRTIAFDANRGFILNGRQVPLRGVNRHQDMEGKGWALNAGDHARDMRLIEELGANSVRLSHYNHAGEFYDLADRSGMVLWAELGLVNVHAPRGESETPPAMLDSARQQLRELIRQNYNHPSVALWSIGNEMTNWSSKGLTPKGARPMMTALNALAHAEDPTRPTTQAACCEPLPGKPDKGQERLSDMADTVGYNLYLGWYGSGHIEEASQLGEVMRGLHAQAPNRPISVGEYGGGGAITQHTDNVHGGKVENISRPQPEEVQAAIHELSWKELEPLDFLWGAYVWQMFDATSDLRQEGDSSDINTKGLVTFDRKVLKDSYLFYQAAWRTDVPVVHLAERRYVDRAYPVVDVRAYSNARQAMLTLNGRLVGNAACSHYVCTWPGVRLAAGENRLEAHAVRNDREAHDAITWRYRGPERALHVRAGSLTGVTLADGTRYGSDNYFKGGAGDTLNPFKRELYAAGEQAAAPPKVVTGTRTPELYAHWRAGKSFRYRLPLPDGRYRVRVHLFEPGQARKGERVFRITPSGGATRAGIDPVAMGGGSLRAIVLPLEAVSKAGILTLDFAAERGEAVVSAIDVEPLE